ncbi:MAG: peptidase and matrixin and adamalysin [Myxococcales bacterium]|nr:peptidase and matrixin and adamalysin [Myxococcales bacterium]
MRGLLFLPVAVLAAQAHAAPVRNVMTVEGDVSAVASRWSSDGSRIITDATVTTPTGDVVVSQLGGTVDGLTMRTIPGPALLDLGMRVAVGAHQDVDLSQRTHVLVDDVKVILDRNAFVRTGPTKSGKYLYWESGCIFVTIDDAGTKEIAGDQEFAVVDASIATWNSSTASCSYMQVMSDGRKAMEVGKDNVNVIKFRDASWCRPAIKDDPARCYAESAAGITTATYVDDSGSSRDGAIVDADIELNGVNFAISDNGQTLGLAGCKADLQNTLTHELGHLHGLEHTCLAAGDPARKDDQGAAVPLCSATSDPKITEATMYNFQDCGETKKQTLEPDDIAAMCKVYPTANDPHSCAPVGSTAGCCSAETDPAGPILLSAATAGLVFVGRRRRRPSKKLDR